MFLLSRSPCKPVSQQHRRHLEWQRSQMSGQQPTLSVRESSETRRSIGISSSPYAQTSTGLWLPHSHRDESGSPASTATLVEPISSDPQELPTISPSRRPSSRSSASTASEVSLSEPEKRSPEPEQRSIHGFGPTMADGPSTIRTSSPSSAIAPSPPKLSRPSASTSAPLTLVSVQTSPSSSSK